MTSSEVNAKTLDEVVDTVYHELARNWQALIF